MNFFCHDYVSCKVLGRNNSLISAGSHIPDFVPFVPGSVFTFEEIHESPEVLLDFLQEHYPDKIDLALAMMAHSVKYGADKFNNISELLLTDEKTKREIIEGIIDCSGVSYDLAAGSRLHSYLWGGADVYIFQNYGEFVNNIKDFHSNIDRNEISKLLSEGYKKDPIEVLRMTNYLFNQIDEDTFVSIDGYIESWKNMLESIGEGDLPDTIKAKSLIMRINALFQDQWEDLINRVIADVGLRMKKFL